MWKKIYFIIRKKPDRHAQWRKLQLKLEKVDILTILLLHDFPTDVMSYICCYDELTERFVKFLNEKPRVKDSSKQILRHFLINTSAIQQKTRKICEKLKNQQLFQLIINKWI